MAEGSGEVEFDVDFFVDFYHEGAGIFEAPLDVGHGEGADGMDLVSIDLDLHGDVDLMRRTEEGEEAVDLANREHPDLIIMDIEMPYADGLDATRRIREHQALRETPIVAVSAYGADEYRVRALAAGCNEYVSTPFEPAALEQLIRNLISKC